MNKTFLKYPGNKSKLSPFILEKINEHVHFIPNRLVEPFCGTCAVSIYSENFNEHYLNDLNQNLIDLYKLVIKDPLFYINETKKLFIKENNCKEKYLELRTQYNQTTDPTLKSILFLYLNRHCFNGLSRFNSKNEFNVPFGKYDSVYFPEKEIKFFAEKLKMADFNCISFDQTFENIKSHDVVYLDPPYVSLSETSSFVDYCKNSWSDAKTKDLINFIDDVKVENVLFVLSNHETDYIKDILPTHAISIDFNVRRSISAEKKSRKHVKELLIFIKK